MGYREISLKLPSNFSEDELRIQIGKELRITSFSYRIEGKSLDARKKDTIFWLVRIAVSSDELRGGAPADRPKLNINFREKQT